MAEMLARRPERADSSSEAQSEEDEEEVHYQASQELWLSLDSILLQYQL